MRNEAFGYDGSMRWLERRVGIVLVRGYWSDCARQKVQGRTLQTGDVPERTDEALVAADLQVTM